MSKDVAQSPMYELERDEKQTLIKEVQKRPFHSFPELFYRFAQVRKSFYRIYFSRDINIRKPDNPGYIIKYTIMGH